MPINSSYNDNHEDFEITNITWEDDYEPQFESPTSNNEEKRERKQEIAERLDSDEEISDTLRKALNEEAFRLDEEIRESEDEESDIQSSITFDYSAPAISVDTSGRFIKHEIIGGTTVRQKIGEDPINIDVNGVCKESTARRLDQLRNAKYARFVSNRLPSSINVQIASTSTSPLNDGGAVDLSDDSGEFLYQYTISAVEVDI